MKFNIGDKLVDESNEDWIVEITDTNEDQYEIYYPSVDASYWRDDYMIEQFYKIDTRRQPNIIIYNVETPAKILKTFNDLEKARDYRDGYNDALINCGYFSHDLLSIEARIFISETTKKVVK